MTAGASDDLAPILDSVRRFVEREVTPHVERLEAAEEAPDHLVRQLGELGLFSLVVPQAFGGLGLPIESCARIMEILAGGWTTLAGYLNSHATVAFLIAKHGTESQKRRFLPAMAAGALPSALTLTEPGAGSDLQAISTVAKTQDGGFSVTGTKVFVTNGRKAGLLLALVRTHPGAEPPARGMSLLLIDKTTPGVTVGTDTPKMAYRHVDTCEINYDGVPVPADCLLGGTPNRGLALLLDGLELGRILIAASAVGLAQAALSQAVVYARSRIAFGKPIADHQAIQLELAGMATKIEAARQLTREAARQKEGSGRADMASAMAKLFASETALEVTTSALRIHGGYGYVRGYAVERLFREAPLYIVGEGTNEIQKLVIARRLLEQTA
ncbi:MAG TPA: acyl-CoA dehydrogenase family protein [Aestuariivirgaceae bacterium]|nr:acyl-CoA dehydrogenase family protein [Aestuariivirgaceae bacterium]